MLVVLLSFCLCASSSIVLVVGATTTNVTPPEQGHLALLSAEDSGMSVTWVQHNSNNGYVRYGTSPTALSEKSVPATYKTYTINK